MRFALLCITTKDMSVRRYVRNCHNKVWVTHEAVIHSVFDGLDKQLETFRQQPESYEVWQSGDAA